MFRYVHLALLKHRIVRYVWTLDETLDVELPIPVCSCGVSI